MAQLQAGTATHACFLLVLMLLLQGALWDWYRQLYREGWNLDANSYSTAFRCAQLVHHAFNLNVLQLQQQLEYISRTPNSAATGHAGCAKTCLIHALACLVLSKARASSERAHIMQVPSSEAFSTGAHQTKADSMVLVPVTYAG
jgi:hypothetical protein